MPESTQKVKFKRGQSETMPSVEAGSLLVQVNTGDIFLDDTDADRIQLGDSRKLSLSGGTMTGPINMGGQKITNLGNPTENTDAANKIFVDTAFQELESAVNQELLTYLPLKGGTMVGAIDMGDYKITSLSTPTDGTDAANKTYVDNAISGAPYLNTSGVTPMAGNLNMANHLISNLVNPSNPQDAATKNYVDSVIGGITGFTVDSNGGNGYANYEALTSAHPTGEVGVFYLVVNPDSSAPNAFDEYFWTGTGYEKAGAFGDVDTSDLATKEELNNKMNYFGVVSNSSHDITITAQSSSNNLRNLTISGGWENGESGTLSLSSEGTSLSTDANGTSMSISLGTDEGLVLSSSHGITLQSSNESNPIKVSGYFSLTGTTNVYMSSGSSGNLLLGNSLSTPGPTLSGTVTISNVGTPDQDNDAANKAYVDSQISGLSSVYLPLSGGTLTGDLTLPRNIKLNFINGTSSIQYTSNWLEIKTYIQGESIILTGTDYVYQFNSSGLDLNSKKITGLATPTADSDAATKQYVDNAVADVQVPASVANQFLTMTAATTATKVINGTKPLENNLFFVTFGNGVTASSGTFTLNFTSGGSVTVTGGGTAAGGGGTFPTMPTIAIPAWTVGTFYMYSDTEAKFISYTNYIDDGVVS